MARSAFRDAAKALLQQRIDKVNAQLASYETIKRFELMPRPLTVEEGLLTATLKVRRKRVYETFRAQLEALYEGAVAPRIEDPSRDRAGARRP